MLFAVAAPSTAPSEAISAVLTVGEGGADGERVLVGEGVEVCVGVIVDAGAAFIFFVVGVGVFGLCVGVGVATRGVGVGTPPTESIEV